MSRNGIACGGNWIVDRIKTVDRLPGRGMLVTILRQEISTGGAPANVLADLARMKVDEPLSGWGRIGNDADGDRIERSFRALGVAVDGLRRDDNAATSFTDVMNEQEGGERMFFHHRGANAGFRAADVPVEALECKIFHLGYLLLLDALDAPDPEFGTGAARLLAGLRARGIRTSLDVVSEESDRYRTLVPPALRYVDYLIVNEIEAGRTVGVEVRDAAGRLDRAGLRTAIDRIAALGPMRLVMVHMREGVAWKTPGGELRSLGACDLPREHIVGAVGAGDAFCAGVLHGLHQDWPVERCARLGNACAAAALSAAGATEGLRPLAELETLGNELGRLPDPL